MWFVNVKDRGTVFGQPELCRSETDSIFEKYKTKTFIKKGKNIIDCMRMSEICQVALVEENSIKFRIQKFRK